MRRRLFKCFEQCVEGPGRKHVNFVDVIDLVSRPARPQRGILPQLAHLLDTIIAGTVDFDHVDILPGGNCLADVARLTRAFSRPLHTIEALREDPCDGRLPDPARSAEKIRLGDPVQTDGVPERVDDMVLADNVLKPLRPVSPCDNGIGRRRNSGRLRPGVQHRRSWRLISGRRGRHRFWGWNTRRHRRRSQLGRRSRRQRQSLLG